MLKSHRLWLALALSLAGCAPQAEDAAGPTAKGAARGETKDAHVVLSGDYLYDLDARAVCVYLPTKALEVTFDAPGMPWVVLRIPDFQGAGTYAAAESRLRANYSGEGVRQSKGLAKAEIQVAAKASGGVASGTFTGEFAGMGGKGTVSGRFAGCEYQLVAEALPAATAAAP